MPSYGDVELDKPYVMQWLVTLFVPVLYLDQTDLWPQEQTPMKMETICYG